MFMRQTQSSFVRGFIPSFLPHGPQWVNYWIWLTIRSIVAVFSFLFLSRFTPHTFNITVNMKRPLSGVIKETIGIPRVKSSVDYFVLHYIRLAPTTFVTDFVRSLFGDQLNRYSPSRFFPFMLERMLREGTHFSLLNRREDRESFKRSINK